MGLLCLIATTGEEDLGEFNALVRAAEDQHGGGGGIDSRYHKNVYSAFYSLGGIDIMNHMRD